MSLKRAPDIFIFIVTGLTLVIHRTHCDIILSELRATTSNGNGYDENREFIEIYNTDNLPVVLSDYTLVLYKGDTNQAYAILPLQHAIAPRSFFTIGTSNVSPQPNQLLDEKSNVNLLPFSAGVALYHGNRGMFVYDMQATNASLIDAVVYDNVYQRNNTELSEILTQGEIVFLANNSDTSLSLCSKGTPFHSSLWTKSIPTPGRQTIAPMSQLQGYPLHLQYLEMVHRNL